MGVCQTGLLQLVTLTDTVQGTDAVCALAMQKF